MTYSAKRSVSGFTRLPFFDALRRSLACASPIASRLFRMAHTRPGTVAPSVPTVLTHHDRTAPARLSDVTAASRSNGSSSVVRKRQRAGVHAHDDLAARGRHMTNAVRRRIPAVGENMIAPREWESASTTRPRLVPAWRSDGRSHTSAKAGARCSGKRHSDPVLPGSFTVVASNAPNFEAPALRYRNALLPKQFHAQGVQPVLRLPQPLQATPRPTNRPSSPSAPVPRSPATSARSRDAGSSVRNKFSTDLSFRRPFNVPVSSANARQSPGKNDTSNSQSSFTLKVPATPRVRQLR